MPDSYKIREYKDFGSELNRETDEQSDEVDSTFKGHTNNKKRSSKGCITCKIRKKRCDEVKPVCGDCKRLNRRCEYITEDMSSKEITDLKEEMKKIEQDSKARKRKRKNLDESNDLTSRKQKQHVGKIVFNPLAMHIASMTNTPTLQGTMKTLPSKHQKSSPAIQASTDTVNQPTNGLNNRTIGSDVTKENSLFSALNINNWQLEKIRNNYQKNQFVENYKNNNNNDTHSNDDITVDNNAHYTSLNLNDNAQLNYNTNVPHNNNTKTGAQNIPFQALLSPSFDVFASFSPLLQNTDNNIQKVDSVSPIPPLSLNGEENQTSFTHAFSNGFPKLIQDHFRTENNESETDSLLQLQEAFQLLPQFQSAPATDLSITNSNYSNTTQISSSNTENYDQILYDSNDEKTKPIGIDDVNIVDTSGRNFTENEKITTIIKSNQPPKIYTNPSVVLNSTLANLTPIGQILYEYYRDRLSFIVCSSPKSENMYLNTFLPMAHIDRSVLYGILAWSAFHLGGNMMEKQGNYYIKLALQGFYKRPILNEEGEGKSKFNYDDVDDADGDIIKENDYDDEIEIYEDLELSSLNKDNMINMRLAAFLILCGVEICKGDVSKWSKYLTYGAELIKLKGGLERFNESKDEHFLATNYAYHDITSIQVINERTLHFDLNEYEKMWLKSNELGFTDPLHGISSPLFKILAEINKLVITVQKLVKRSLKDETNKSSELQANEDKEENKSFNKNQPIKRVDESPDERLYCLDTEDYWIGEEFDVASVGSSVDELFIDGIPSTVSDEWIDEDFNKEVMLEDLDHVMVECQNIEQKIISVKPKITSYVTERELELQLTMFECFQVTTKLHLRQSVLRLNSASIEIQYLTGQLINLLDVLLGTDVEACLCFPIFIAGMNCVRKKDRDEMMKRFESFIKRYKWKNVSRCQIVTRYIWKLNCKGERFVDWYAVVKRLGWDLSFA